MKFLHTSDLHIGKRLNEHSLEDDQTYIFSQIIDIAKEEQVDAIVAAGDIYDKSLPSTEAVGQLDELINKISDTGIPLLIISGNHDSPQRLDFGSKLLEKSGIYISGIFDGNVKMVKIAGVEFYLLPFIRPSAVRTFYPDAEINNTEDAIKTVLEQINPGNISVIVSHQTVTCSSSELIRCESETKAIIGGSDAVDYSVYDKFSYAALGHIHSAQSVGRETVRYSGTPLKYSKSETDNTKSVSIVTVSENKVDIKERILHPLHEMRVIRGELEELLKKEVYNLESTDDYVYVVLTDEITSPDCVPRIKNIYKHCAGIEIDNLRNSYDNDISAADEGKDDVELFCEFFKLQNNRDITEEEIEIIKLLLQEGEIV